MDYICRTDEPTLHIGTCWLIRQIKRQTDLPVAVITNSSFLYLSEVRQELSAADAVIPTLDAGTPELYRRVNRPYPQATHERLVEGLTVFRSEYGSKLWPEVMPVRESNDSEEALREIAAVLRLIQPDEVHINLPTRPPSESWGQPPRQREPAEGRNQSG